MRTRFRKPLLYPLSYGGRRTLCPPARRGRALGGLVRAEAARAFRRRLALRPDLLGRAAQRLVGGARLEEYRPVLREINSAGGAGSHCEDHRHGAPQPDPELLVEREPPRPAV